MAGGGITVGPTIDRRWLDRAAAEDPVAHAYALWDLERFPDRVHFVSVRRDDTTTGYLLVWRGRAAVVVHWFGAAGEVRELAGELPPRPLVVVAPEEVRAEVERVRGPLVSYPVRMLVAPPAGRSAGPPTDERTRRLTGADRPALTALTAGEEEPVASEYPSMDLDREVVWGAFEDGRLRGVARATATLPSVWILGGVYVAPAARGWGHGLALVRAALAAARASGATVGLYVREDRPAARAIYARAGFRAHRRLAWLDAGAGLAP